MKTDDSKAARTLPVRSFLCPTCSCRSTREPRCVFRSFMGITRTRVDSDGPIDRLRRFFRPSAVQISHPAANVCAVSMQTPSGKSEAASSTARNSSNREPSTITLPRGVFKQDLQPVEFQSSCSLLQSLRNRGDSFLRTAFFAAPWVRHQKIRAKRNRSHNFLMERLDRTRAQHRIRRCEIDQIIVVDNQRP